MSNVIISRSGGNASVSTDNIEGILPIAKGGTGNSTGLAASATILATSRTVQVNLASTSSASFDGSEDITPGVTGTLDIANGGTGGTTAALARSNLAINKQTYTSLEQIGLTMTSELTRMDVINALPNHSEIRFSTTASIISEEFAPGSNYLGYVVAYKLASTRFGMRWERVGSSGVGTYTCTETSSTTISDWVEVLTENSSTGGWELGEIRTFASGRTDLGSDYLLCDGSILDYDDYSHISELCALTGVSVTTSFMRSLEYYSIVGCNDNFYGYSSSAGKFYYSTDRGKTAITGSGIGFHIYCSCYHEGTYLLGCTNSRMFYSTDGISWTQVSGLTGSHTVYDIKWCNDRFIACTGDSMIQYSTNGKSWSSATDISSSLRSAVYGNGIYVCGGSGNISYYSTDGTSWIAGTIGFTSTYTSSLYILAITYGNGMFVATTTYDGIIYSTDGKTWNQCNLDVESTSTVNYSSIYYDDRGYFVAGLSNRGIFYSTDGINFTRVVSSLAGTMVYSDGVYWAPYNAYYSYDGINWNTAPGNTTGCFCYCGAAGKVFISCDITDKSYRPKYIDFESICLPPTTDVDNSQYTYMRVN